MPGFFLLAGFLLASSYREPMTCKDTRRFYRNRVVAAHPLYLLAVLFGVVTIALIDHTKLGNDLPSVSGTVYYIIMAVFAQLAWPWGMLTGELLMALGNLWFTSAYYFCLLLFPLLHNLTLRQKGARVSCDYYILRPLCVRYLCCPVFLTWVLTELLIWTVSLTYGIIIGALWEHNKLNPDIFTYFLLLGHACPFTWLAIFFLGMLLFRLLEINRQPGSYLWPYWGICTDFCTFVLLIGTLCVGLFLPTEAVDAASHYWSGDLLSWKLVLPFLCVCMYGLAIGDGMVARVLSTKLVVKYLSPAAYAVYLFQTPVIYGWRLLVRHRSSGVGLNDWMDFLGVLTITVTLGLFLVHKVNDRLTSAFLRVFDWLCRRLCCGCLSSTMETKTNMEKIQEAVKGLTGADVQPETLILECGFDSFGSSALLGLLRPMFAGLTLTPLELYRLGTFSELLERIEQDLGQAETPPLLLSQQS